MKKTKQFFKNILVLGLSLYLILVYLPCANAAINLKSLKTPLTLVLENDLSVEKSNIDDIIVLDIPDTLVYSGQTIPQDSKFYGKITEVKKSKRYGRSGFLKIRFEKICSANSICINSDELDKRSLYIKLYSEKVQINKIYSDGILGTIIMVGEMGIDVVVPGVGTTLMGIQDVHSEFKKDPEKKRSVAGKIANGLWESTWIPAVIRYFKVSPNPKYQSGQSIKIRFNPNFLGKVFNILKIHRIYVEHTLD